MPLIEPASEELAGLGEETNSVHGGHSGELGYEDQPRTVEPRRLRHRASAIFDAMPQHRQRIMIQFAFYTNARLTCLGPLNSIQFY